MAFRKLQLTFQECSEKTFMFSEMVKDTPSLRLVVDFGAWNFWWIFWCLFFFFSGRLPWKNKQEKIHRKIHHKNRQFSRELFDQNSSQGKFCLERWTSLRTRRIGANPENFNLETGNSKTSTTTTTTQRARQENLQSETLVPSTPTVDMEMLEKTSKTISTIAILWPVKAIFENMAATVEADTLIHLKNGARTEPEPSEPFKFRRNWHRNGNRRNHFFRKEPEPCLSPEQKYRRTPFPRGTIEPKTGTARTAPWTNLNWTEQWPYWIYYILGARTEDNLANSVFAMP